MLVAYYKEHRKWPTMDYKDSETGASLAIFLNRAIEGSISLTDAQRSALKAVDADIFRNKRGGDVSISTGKATMRPHQPPSSPPEVSSSKPSPPSPAAIKTLPKDVSPPAAPILRPSPSAAAHMRPVTEIKGVSKEEKVHRLLQYFNDHGSWPGFTYRDPETHSALGAFLDLVITRQVHLPRALRKALRSVDRGVFKSRRGGIVRVTEPPRGSRKRAVQAKAFKNVHQGVVVNTDVSNVMTLRAFIPSSRLAQS